MLGKSPIFFFLIFLMHGYLCAVDRAQSSRDYQGKIRVVLHQNDEKKIRFHVNKARIFHVKNLMCHVNKTRMPKIANLQNHPNMQHAPDHTFCQIIFQ